MTQQATHAKHFWGDVVLFQVSTLLIQRPTKNQGGLACRADLQLAICGQATHRLRARGTQCAPPCCPSPGACTPAQESKKGGHKSKMDTMDTTSPQPGQVIAYEENKIQA